MYVVCTLCLASTTTICGDDQYGFLRCCVCVCVCGAFRRAVVVRAVRDGLLLCDKLGGTPPINYATKHAEQTWHRHGPHGTRHRHISRRWSWRIRLFALAGTILCAHNKWNHKQIKRERERVFDVAPPKHRRTCILYVFLLISDTRTDIFILKFFVCSHEYFNIDDDTLMVCMMKIVQPSGK